MSERDEVVKVLADDIAASGLCFEVTATDQRERTFGTDDGPEYIASQALDALQSLSPEQKRWLVEQLGMEQVGLRCPFEGVMDMSDAAECDEHPEDPSTPLFAFTEGAGESR